MIEPFGYFRAEPFGWTDCSETDEGAVPLYEQSVVTNLQQRLAHITDDTAGLRVLVREAEKPRDDLLADLKESDAVRNRLATLLSETAIALKGEEAALQRHSWHDLPVVALSAMIEIEMLKGQRNDLLTICRNVVERGIGASDVKAMKAAIASVKADQFRDATKMIDETSGSEPLDLEAIRQSPRQYVDLETVEKLSDYAVVCELKIKWLEKQLAAEQAYSATPREALKFWDAYAKELDIPHDDIAGKSA